VTGIDVVIPAFNAAAYIAEAIASAQSQTLAPDRIIVVDDGSADTTAEVATAAGALVIRQANRGISGARNTGVAASHAPWLAFLDADDRWSPQKLERQRAALEGRTKALSLCHLSCFASPELPEDERAALEAKHPARIAGWLASALFLSRASFDAVGGFAEDLPVAETIDWFNRAKLAGLEAIVLDETLVSRRLHRHNTTRGEASQKRGYALAAKRHLDRLRAARSATTP
jgi:glycosyltransferase involved in cell wall biosynthesis